MDCRAEVVDRQPESLLLRRRDRVDRRRVDAGRRVEHPLARSTMVWSARSSRASGRSTVAACALVVGGGFAIPRLGFQPHPRGRARPPPCSVFGSVSTTDSNPEPVVPPDAAVRPISARMLGPASPIPIRRPSSGPERVADLSDGRTLVAVAAGSPVTDPLGAGRLVVVPAGPAFAARRFHRRRRATGPLAITAAPLGTVRRSAREDRESRSAAGQTVVASSFRPRRSRNPHKKLTPTTNLPWPSTAAPIE